MNKQNPKAVCFEHIARCSELEEIPQITSV
jgi:hypothetical protein